jgi:hypothetical protein
MEENVELEELIRSEKNVDKKSNCNNLYKISIFFMIFIVFTINILQIIFVLYYYKQIDTEYYKIKNIIDEDIPIIKNLSYTLNNMTIYINEFKYIITEAYILSKKIGPDVNAIIEEFNNITQVFIPQQTDFVNYVKTCVNKYGICNPVFINELEN